MYTAAFKKSFLDVELLCHKLSLSVSLFDTTNLDLNEEEVDNMPEDQTSRTRYFSQVSVSITVCST